MGPNIVYKEFYNKDRGLPEPIWGPKANPHLEVRLRCPTCGSRRIYHSASADDPEEIIIGEAVRCKRCGHITDWYEARKQGENHPLERPLKVVHV